MKLASINFCIVNMRGLLGARKFMKGLDAINLNEQA